jgi:hypothetical protein
MMVPSHRSPAHTGPPMGQQQTRDDEEHRHGGLRRHAAPERGVGRIAQKRRIDACRKTRGVLDERQRGQETCAIQ